MSNNRAEGSTHLRDLVDAFAREAAEHFHDFKEFLGLYYESPERIDLLNATAKGFFSDLFHLYLDRIVLNVSRLTDLSRLRSHRNLSVNAVHEHCRSEANYPTARAAELVSRLNATAKSLARWRSKRVAHIDLQVALGAQGLEEQVIPREIQRFYDTLESYVDLVYETIFSDVFPIDAISYYGVLDLVRALREGMVLRAVLESDPPEYDRIVRNSSWHST